jgi:hypothetical protein
VPPNFHKNSQEVRREIWQKWPNFLKKWQYAAIPYSFLYFHTHYLP